MKRWKGYLRNAESEGNTCIQDPESEVPTRARSSRTSTIYGINVGQSKVKHILC